MTTEQPQAAQRPRLLRRRATDRVIGGVAAGIADYFNIDPVLVRAIFVGLVVFGGAGILLYLGAWLLIPVEGRDESPLEQVLPSFGGLTRVILAIVAFIILITVLLPDWRYFDGWPAVGIIALVVGGIFLLRRGGPSEAGAPAASSAAAAPAAAAPFSGGEPAAAAPRAAEPRSPLAWYITAAVLIAVGVAAVIDRATTVTLLPGQFFGLALTVIGAGLVIGSWWGRARVLILPALLVLLIGIPAAFMTVPVQGGIGGPYYAPTSMDELEDHYQLAFGKLTLDLTQLPVSTEPIEVSAAVSAGGLEVVVPENAQVQVDTDVGAGFSYVLGDSEGGTDLTNHYVSGDLGRLIVLDLDVGLGGIEVDTAYDQAFYEQYELELGDY